MDDCAFILCTFCEPPLAQHAWGSQTPQRSTERSAGYCLFWLLCELRWRHLVWLGRQWLERCDLITLCAADTFLGEKGRWQLSDCTCSKCFACFFCTPHEYMPCTFFQHPAKHSNRPAARGFSGIVHGCSNRLPKKYKHSKTVPNRAKPCQRIHKPYIFVPTRAGGCSIFAHFGASTFYIFPV